jgi:hypothetical protein
MIFCANFLGGSQQALVDQVARRRREEEEEVMRPLADRNCRS